MSGRPWQRCYSRISLSSTRNNPVTPPDSHGLPLSPILESSADKPARQRQSLESLSPFQKALAANPHAQALASPVRQCCFTGVRLPSHFLLPFTTVFHLDKNAKPVPHFVPVDRSKQTARSYAFNSRALIRRLGQKRAWHRLIVHELKFDIKRKDDYQWSAEMDLNILHQLRHTVLHKLRWAINKPKAKLVVPLGQHDQRPSSVCILYLRRRDQQSASLPAEPTLQESTIEYILPDLLGDETLRQLLEGTQFTDSDAVILAQSYMTLSAHAALARLSTFLHYSEAAPKKSKKD